MKASEVVKKLLALIEEHGDVDAMLYDSRYSNVFVVDRVEYNQSYKTPLTGPVPEHILLE